MEQKTKKSNKELDRIEKILLEKYSKITPTGKISTIYARRLLSFLHTIFANGTQRMENYWFTNKTTRKKAIRDLEIIGCDKKYMEKWHKIYKKENPPREVTLIQLNFDLNNQTPKDYEPPQSRYKELIEKYLQKETDK